MTLKEWCDQHTQQELANRCQVNRTRVTQWVKKGDIPAERAVQIERVTGGQVTRAELRPDLWEE